MFAKSNWAIIGIDMDPEREPQLTFVKHLHDQSAMISYSQLAAAQITKVKNVDSFGINPFDRPRLDETADDPTVLLWRNTLVEYALQYKNREEPTYKGTLPIAGYGFGASAYRLGNEYMFGFWFVKNEWKDVNHLASVKEGISYKTTGQPYKILTGQTREDVDTEASTTPAVARKQFPVLLDFVAGRVYIQSTSKTEIEAVKLLLLALGVPTIGLAWQFPGYVHWPSAILTQVYHSTAYPSEFLERAKEAETIPKENYKIHDDAEIQKLVTHYYATAEVGFDYWLSLSAKARVKLSPMGSTIQADTNEVATSLLSSASGTAVYASAITIQERITYVKNDVESSFRTDAATMVLDDGINMPEAGAAMLRGFDAPQFKRQVRRDIRKSKQVPSIGEFWSMWLIWMKNSVSTIEMAFRHVLNVPDGAPGGILPMELAAGTFAAEEPFIEEAVAV